MSLDRVNNNRLSLTHDLLANSLGVRREGVTEAAGKLQRQGVIEYHRGNITVLDRSQLEKACCECYSVVSNEEERLLPRKKTTSLESETPAEAYFTKGSSSNTVRKSHG